MREDTLRGPGRCCIRGILERNDYACRFKASSVDWDREFPFELYVCRWAERCWPPGIQIDDEEVVLVGRQVGTQHRRWDTVVVTTTAEQLRQRARFGSRELDRDLLRVVKHAPASWEWYRDAIPDPGFPWRYVRAAVHRAADRELVETQQNGRRLEYRRRWPFPDWPVRLIAIENKPDLNASAARQLQEQLRHDVDLGLADETWVATRATDRRAEPALFEDIPVEAGILAVDPETDTVRRVWHARQLAIESTGTQRTREQTAEATTVDTAWKHQRRLTLAERVYGRGWRSFVDSMRPDCRYFGVTEVATGLLPACEAKGYCPTQGECAANCSAFEPEPPAWRMDEWPLDGGPGKRIKQLLAARRRRRRIRNQS